MVAELNHRVKNILAIVQSVAAQTVRSSGSLENFADAFTGRLKALAIAHDLLTQTRWIGIGLNELLAAVLAPHRSADETARDHLWPVDFITCPGCGAVVHGVARDDDERRKIRRAVDASRHHRYYLAGKQRRRQVGRAGLAGAWWAGGQTGSVGGFRHKIDRSRYQPRSRRAHQNRFRSSRRALDDYIPNWRICRASRNGVWSSYRITGLANTFSQIRRSSLSSNGLATRGIVRNGAGKSVTSS